MRSWVTLVLVLIGASASAQTSKPAPAREPAAEVLAEAQRKLQAFATYEAYDLAEIVLASEPKHARATRLRDAAQVLALAIDGQVVRTGGKQVTLSVGSDDRVLRGAVFTIYRGAKPCALARVIQVARDTCVAEVFERKLAPRAGDSATSSGEGWTWYRTGAPPQAPQTKHPRLLREACMLAESRRLYDLYRTASRAPKDPQLQAYVHAALLAQRVVKGRVTSLQGGVVEVDVGLEHGLRKGDHLTFLREGQARATLRVSTLGPKRATGRSVQGTVEVGDVATTDPALWAKPPAGRR